ncbi:DUF1289 domain-containing protein [Ahrensia kielensis]|uniref:DUF1289 domain-containing protein n=1 Tax=Ahrensia kielensis TaxID=76980 RepID=UPI000364F5F9|nr:DUF1289 domain-containing protein [Ahrensia kielensis]
MESPCILLCSIDMNTGHCYGCGRTRDEIAAWTVYSDERRKELMQELPARVAKIETRPRRVTKRRAMKNSNKSS